MRKSRIGGYGISPSEPVRVVAELGVCHRGDLDIAKNLVDHSVSAMADFIKFELYELDRALSEPYRKKYSFKFNTLNDGEKEDNLFDLFEKSFLSYSKAKQLIKHINKSKVPFFATVTSIDGTKFLMDEGACAVKLSSGEIDHIPLIHYCGENKIPVFIDTAKTYLWEIIRAVEEYEISGGVDVIVMQNPVGYPCKPNMIDLKRIDCLAKALSIPQGFTCHSIGRNAVLAAIGMGAKVIEKPISPNKNLPYVEYAFSENAEDFSSFVKDIKEADLYSGESRRIWNTKEIEENRLNRHGLVASNDLKKGHILSESDIDIARPGFGLRPENKKNIIGKRILKALKKGEIIDWSVF